jgi:aspartate aminotransferase-like enzyme
MTRAAVEALGLKLFAPDAPAAAVTAVLPPDGVDSGVIVKELKSRFAAVITNGQGEMKGQIFRIAHLGYFDYMDTIASSARWSRSPSTRSRLPARSSATR